MNQIKCIGLSLLIILLPSCSPTKYFIKGLSSKMTELVIDEQSTVHIGDNNIYVDENIELAVGLSPENFRFINLTIQNKTNKPISIDWRNVSLITKNGQSITLRIKGDVSSVMIPPYAHILENNRTYIYDRSLIMPYYYTKNISELEQWIKYYINQELTLFLPLIYDGNKTIYYKAKIVVNGVDILQHNPDAKYNDVIALPDLLTK